MPFKLSRCPTSGAPWLHLRYPLCTAGNAAGTVCLSDAAACQSFVCTECATSSRLLTSMASAWLSGAQHGAFTNAPLPVSRVADEHITPVTKWHSPDLLSGAEANGASPLRRASDIFLSVFGCAFTQQTWDVRITPPVLRLLCDHPVFWATVDRHCCTMPCRCLFSKAAATRSLSLSCLFTWSSEACPPSVICKTNVKSSHVI